MAVYVIQAGEGGPVKIGVAVDVRKRIAGLKTASPLPLNILHVFEGGEVEERALHRRFAEHRHAGEWFAPVPEIISGDFGLVAAEKPNMARKRSASTIPAICSGLDLAIDKVGTAKALGDLLGLQRSTISLWRKGRVPAERAIEIEAKVGVSRHCLRPDLWSEPVVAPAPASPVVVA